MPVVPVSTGPQIAPTELPQGRFDRYALTPHETAFTGTLPDEEGLQHTAHLAAGWADEAKQKADEVAITGADGQLVAAQTQLLYGTPDSPESGILNRRGQASFTAPEDLQQGWKKAVAGVMSGLTNDTQRMAITRMASNRFGEMNMQVQRHVATQMDQHDEDQLNILLQKEGELALQNYQQQDLVEGSVARQKEALVAYAARHPGLPDGWLEQQQLATSSRTYAGVIDRMVNNKQDLAASQFYAAHQSDISGSVQSTLDKVLGHASVLGEAQRQSDAIMTSTTSLLDGLAKAAQITNPQVREETERLVRQAHQDIETNARQAQEDAFRQAGQVLESTGRVRDIPHSVWVAIGPDKQEDLRRREEQIRDPKRVTDPGTYYKLMNMAGLSDLSRQAFQNVNLLQYRDKLSDEDFRHLAEMQYTQRTRTEGAVASEAKRQSGIADQAAKKAADRAAAAKLLEAAGIHIPPTVPGAPMNTPTTGGGSGTTAPGSPLGSPVPSATGSAAVPGVSPRTPQSGRAGPQLRVPQAWLDHAARDPNYRLYLQHMGVPVP